MGVMKNLIVVAHPDKKSFCRDGIVKTIIKTLKTNGEEVNVIDLYAENKTFEFEYNKIQEYKSLITNCDRIYIVSPVWWFRTTPALESFFDQVFTPGFAYNFIPITKLYGYPKPLLSNKKARTYLTHGAPALPVVSLYLNSVKLRLVMGVYSFVFGWFKTKTRQFWSVPFVSQEKREEYLKRVEKDIKNDLKK
jgi:putative NADPH-quinone reductase